MSYRWSSEDKKNADWFTKDNSRASLASIELTKGAIRGLTQFEKMEFDYPIAAIAGANGSGKSTLLAMAACAFHNYTKGFVPPLRKQSYYTFGDFFIQSVDETPPEGVEITYRIQGIKKKPGSGVQMPAPLQTQKRTKPKGGRWNDYHTRVKRNVIYFGVQRVVPHFERGALKSYRAHFKPGNIPAETRARIAKIAGRIIGKTYDDFDSYKHRKYTLPKVKTGQSSYSGFNMGAGESAVFEILTALFQAGAGTLLIIDEIELGLHEKAQLRLIEQLKTLCLELKCQVICSTHSHAILSSLPPPARFFIETIGAKTVVTKGISADFACGKMGKPDAHELDVFVEDDNAATIVTQALPLELRKRCKVHPIGSHGAVLRQLTSRYMEDVDNCICILDGDQSGDQAQAIKQVADWSEASTETEKQQVRDWTALRLHFLPGTTWPEKWLLDTAIDFFEDDILGDASGLAKCWGLGSDAEVLEKLRSAVLAEKHNEFFELAEALELPVERVREDLCRCVALNHPHEFAPLIAAIKVRLPS